MASDPKKAAPDDWEDVEPEALPDDWEDAAHEVSALPDDDSASPVAATPEPSGVTPVTPLAPAVPTPTAQGPTFYIRDTKGGFQPISKANADNAASMGLRVLSEAEVRGIRAATPPQPTVPSEKKPPPDPGFFSTVGRQFLQGFTKMGADEATGAVSYLHDTGPGTRYRMPDGTLRPAENSGDLYRAVRDSEREVNRGASEHYPWTSFASSMAGDIASDALLNYFGVPVASTPYQVASGALSGLMGSDAELTPSKTTGRDVLSAGASTGLGAGLGYVVPKVGAAVSKHLTPAIAARMRQWLEESAIKQGRRVLLNGADALAGNKELPDEVVREALSSKAIEPFGTTQKAYQNLETLADVRGENYGNILKRLQEAGVEGPNVEALASKFESEAADRWKNSGSNKSVADIFAAEADNIRAVAPPAPNSFSLVGEGPMAVAGPRLAPEPRVAPPAPSAPVPPSGPVVSPPLGPLPVRAAPVWTPAATEATTAGRPRSMPALLDPPPASVVPDDAPPVAPAATAFRDAILGPMMENLPLNQAERIKRVLQGEARWDRLRMTGLDEAKQEVSSAYRKAIEDSIAEAGEKAPLGSEVSELASEFLPVKQQLARTIGARDAAERGTAAAAKRRGISLTDYLSAAAAAGAGPAGQLLAAAGNNFARNRGTSAWAAGAFGASKLAGELVNPQNAERAGSLVSAALARRATIGGSDGQRGVVDSDAYRQMVMSNPQAFGAYSRRLTEAAEQGPEAFAIQDYMLAQSDPGYAETRKRAMMQANGEQP